MSPGQRTTSAASTGSRDSSPRAQQSMMALGGAIGTGLFLASGLSVNIAGPAVVLSYVIVAGVSILLGRALTEMAVAHPTAGAFGVYAGMYVSPFAGYAVRVSYWLMEVIATGGQLVAASIYMSVLVSRRARRGVGARLRRRARCRQFVGRRHAGRARVLARHHQAGGHRDFRGRRAAGDPRPSRRAATRTQRDCGGRRAHAVRPVGRVVRLLLRDLLVHRRRDRRDHLGRGERSLASRSRAPCGAWCSACRRSTS